MYLNKFNKRFFSGSLQVSFFLLLSLALINSASAQKKVERFCKLDIFLPSEHKANVSVNYGDRREFLQLTDSATLVELDKVNNFKNDVDAINYMNKLGWSCVQIVGLNQFRYECFFKKAYETSK